MEKRNDFSLDEELIQATCAVIIDEKVQGTAWLFSHEGYLLTAGHVLGKQNPVEELQVRFSEDTPRRAYKIQWGYQKEMGIDFAIVKIDDLPTDRMPLPISLAQQISGDFKLHGYGKSLFDRSGGKGEFISPFDPQNTRSNRLFQLRSQELGEGGYSGGAVYSDQLRAVVAVQVEATRANTGAGRDTILAMPLYRIVPHWAQLQEIAERGQPTTITSSDILERSPHLGQGQVDFLHDAIKAYVAHMQTALQDASAILPDEPYKKFIHYELTDEKIFFGREQQTQQLLRHIRRRGKSNRIIVLHGASGTGKTSLINAGMVPALLRKDIVPI